MSPAKLTRSPACYGASLGALIILLSAVLSPVAALESPSGFSDTVKRLLPAVVTVTTTQTVDNSVRAVPGFPDDSPLHDFFRDEFGAQPQQPRQINALGSGFIIDENGFIVTNSHVITGADEISVVTADDRSHKAELVGEDPLTDLALLKIDPAGIPAHTVWGDSDKANVGDWAIAIGNPFGLGGSVTVGVLSARARNINAGPYDDFLQTDTPINQGNSGGPLFNSDGQVIGVNTIILSPGGGNIGIAFAIPANFARPIIDQLKDKGRVDRGWLGVSMQPVSEDIAEALGLGEPRGALVADVFDGSPAKRAGVKSGDVILKFGGAAIDSAHELPRVVADRKAGETVAMEIWRQDRMITKSVKIANRSESPVARDADGGKPEEPQRRLDGSLGIHMAELTPEVRKRLDIPRDVEGALIVEVEPGTPAAAAGLEPGDVIEMVGSRIVSEPEDVKDAVEKAGKQSRTNILLRLNRNGAKSFVAVPSNVSAMD